MPKPAEQLKPMPQFRSHEEAGEFWMPHDTTEYIDWIQAQKVRFTTLRPSAYRRLVPSAALTNQTSPWAQQNDFADVGFPQRLLTGFTP